MDRTIGTDYRESSAETRVVNPKRDMIMIKQDIAFDAVAFVCTNKRPDGHPKPCCADRGGADLRETLRAMAAERGLDHHVRIYASGCQGGCEHGPMVMTFPDGTMRFGVTEADLPGLLDELAAQE